MKNPGCAPDCISSGVVVFNIFQAISNIITVRRHFPWQYPTSLQSDDIFLGNIQNHCSPTTFSLAISNIIAVRRHFPWRYPTSLQSDDIFLGNIEHHCSPTTFSLAISNIIAVRRHFPWQYPTSLQFEDIFLNYCLILPGVRLHITVKYNAFETAWNLFCLSRIPVHVKHYHWKLHLSCQLYQLTFFFSRLKYVPKNLSLRQSQT
jgi:hypothetical protein